MNVKVLSATTLKLVSMVVMVLDHFCWFMWDIHTPQAQVIHWLGRLAIPMLAYFLVEGFFYTSNLKKFMLRLFICGLVSMVPFTIYFWDMYGIRQNIMIDYLLGLICLYMIDSPKVKMFFKVLTVALVMLYSVFLSGWPVVPVMFILIFYNFMDKFKLQVICVAIVSGAYEAMALIYYAVCNMTGKVDTFQSTWWERLYILGFIGPVFVTRYLYSGKRGGERLGKSMKWIFYGFYPVHLVILIILRLILVDSVIFDNFWKMS